MGKAIGTVEKALLEGSVLVLVFLYLFLGNIRSTLIVVATLPLSVLFAFIAMRISGLSANLMSLGGLGGPGRLVVDGALTVQNLTSSHCCLLVWWNRRIMKILRIPTSNEKP